MRRRLHLLLMSGGLSRSSANDGSMTMPQRLPPYGVPNGNALTCWRRVALPLALGQPTQWSAPDLLLERVALLSWDSTIRYVIRAALLAWPTTTPCG